MSRTIVIGDVHGCAEELRALLLRLGRQPGDEFIFLGDLVNKGPDSHGAIRLVRELPQASCLLGNHELRLLNYRRDGDKKPLKDYDWETLRTLEPADWAFLENLPLTRYLPALGIVLVHGGFLPNQPWQDQPADVVTRIQVIDEKGRPRKRNDAPQCPSWADLWQGPPFVIYGHTPRPEIYRTTWALGIDTGCVYGGHLTACILPEKEIVQVPALRKY